VRSHHTCRQGQDHIDRIDAVGRNPPPRQQIGQGVLELSGRPAAVAIRATSAFTASG
jgi:hypothetical protein